MMLTTIISTNNASFMNSLVRILRVLLNQISLTNADLILGDMWELLWAVCLRHYQSEDVNCLRDLQEPVICLNTDYQEYSGLNIIQTVWVGQF
jgi:hypothetical protein